MPSPALVQWPAVSEGGPRLGSSLREAEEHRASLVGEGRQVKLLDPECAPRGLRLEREGLARAPAQASTLRSQQLGHGLQIRIRPRPLGHRSGTTPREPEQRASL